MTPDQDPHGRLRPADHRLFQGAEIHRRQTRRREFGDRLAVDYVWNIMDHGHKAEDILTLVENGEITLGYQSSSYLTDRVPELGFVDLPFLFSPNAQARAAMDGELGAFSRARPKSGSAIASSAGSRTAFATSPTGCARCICRPT